MLNKATVIETISKFPNQFSVDDLVDKMILLEKIEEGLSQSEKNEVITEEQLDKEIDEWLK